MISRGMRRATQPTHDSNRRALAILAVFLVAVLAWFLVTHHIFGGSSTAAAKHTVSHPPAASATAHKAPAPAGPAPNFSRNPFQAG